MKSHLLCLASYIIHLKQYIYIYPSSNDFSCNIHVQVHFSFPIPDTFDRLQQQPIRHFHLIEIVSVSLLVLQRHDAHEQMVIHCTRMLNKEKYQRRLRLPCRGTFDMIVPQMCSNVVVMVRHPFLHHVQFYFGVCRIRHNFLFFKNICTSKR